YISSMLFWPWKLELWKPHEISHLKLGIYINIALFAPGYHICVWRPYIQSQRMSKQNIDIGRVDGLRVTTDQTHGRIPNSPLIGLHRSEFAGWMLRKGKEPDKGIGLSQTTAQNYLDRFDQIQRVIHRKVGLENPPYLIQDEAELIVQWFVDDEWVKQNGEERSESDKRKHVNTLEKYFEFREDKHGIDGWKSPTRFNQSSYRSPDKLSLRQRFKLRAAALEYGSLPSYSDVTPSQRDKIKSYLAQKLGKSKSDITPEEWERESNGLKEASLIWTTLDTGLTPLEIERATTRWPSFDNDSLKVPTEQASKHREKNKLALMEVTADLLRDWMEERAHREKYEDTDALWLNRQGNRYESGPLNNLLRNLCEHAGIDITNRRICWYSIRHSLGEYIETAGDLLHARDQLRHETIESTRRYSGTTLEQRQDALKEIYQNAKDAADFNGTLFEDE
ncbi:MAG: tyrosine-type recombinase/integrase, partial [Haloferacaceae archaeon]